MTTNQALRRRHGESPQASPVATPGDGGWTREIVFDRLCEAAETLRRLPDRERRFLHAGGNGAWPEVLQRTAELFAAAVSRGGYDPIRVQLGAPPPAWIDRMGEVIGWLAWLQPGELHIVWALAGGVRVERLRRRIGCHRDTVRNRKNEALRRIVAQLTAAAAPVVMAERTAERKKMLTASARSAESRLIVT